MNLAYLDKYADKAASPVNILAFFIACFFLLTLRPYPLWILHPMLFFAPLIIGVFTYTLILSLNGALEGGLARHTLCLTLLVFALYVSLPLFGHSLNLMTLSKFLPVLCLVYYPKMIVMKVFGYFHQMMVVICLFSVVLFLLLFARVEPPHFIIPAFTLVTERANDFYRVYGLAVSSTNTVYDVAGFSFARVMGPFLEPGHFAIYLGLTLFLEKYFFNTTNKIIVLAGVLTFSPAFVISYLLILFYDIVIKRQFKVLLAFFFGGFMLTTVAMLDDNIRETTYFLVVERNFSEDSDESFLDRRASKIGREIYEEFTYSNDYLVGRGVEELTEIGILSDYRGFIFKFGLVGMAMLIILLFQLFRLLDFRSSLLFIPMLIVILAHRAWMFESQYLFVFLLLAGLYINGEDASRENKRAML